MYIALQTDGLASEKPGPRNRTGVSGLVPGAVGRLVFVVVAWWLAFQVDGSGQILVDGRFGRYLYCAALGVS